MTKQVDIISLAPFSLGTSRTLNVYRFGTRGARPRVYIQAGLHADELAAPLTAHHLVCLLSEADAKGEVIGDITVVPMANPVGTSQYTLTRFHGRYELAMGRNFNRGFPDASETTLGAVDGEIGADANANRDIVASATRAALAEMTPGSEAEALQLELLKQACSAEIVLDLHTDSDAEMHLYLDPEQWPDAEDLAAHLGAEVVMLARASGGNPFEETVAAPWLAVRGKYGAGAVELPLTTVVELRGVADAYDDMAHGDALGLLAFLRGRGAISGKPRQHKKFGGIAAPFEATQLIIAPCPGIVAFKRDLGAMVSKGDVVAEIVDVTRDNAKAARTPVFAETDGRLFARSLEKLARPGLPIGKIQGTEPIRPSDSYLLTD